MKRTLAITAATAALAFSLAACGAGRGNGMSGSSTTPSGIDGTTATDTMRGENGGTGTTGGATANTDTAKNGLGAVTGAVNSGREPTRYGMTHSDDYTAANNGGVSAETRYKLMLENARVHDHDGFLLDGENASYRTF